MTEAPAVALLFEDVDLGAHLRKALVDAGARIVYEGPATKATREDLSGNGADIVIVNLDDTVERHLDALYEILDEDTQRILFNDAEVSSGLSGWDLARWARHLAAKLMNAHDVDPPRPEQGRPIESHPTELMLPDAEMPEAPPAQDPPISWDANNPGREADAKGLSESDSANLTAELEALLAEDADLLAPHEEATSASSGQWTAVDIEMDAPGLPDIDADAVSFAEPPAAASADSGADARAEQAQPADTDNAPSTRPAVQADPADAWMSDSPVGDSPSHEVEDQAFEDALRLLDAQLAEHDDETDEEPENGNGAEHAADTAESGPNGDTMLDFEDIPELTELQIGEPDPETPRVSEASDDSKGDEAVPSGLSFSLVDPEQAPDTDHAPEKVHVEGPVAPDWDLVDFDVTPESGEQDGNAGDRADPTAFGIEKVSAAEYLAPEAGAEADADEPRFSLELEPLEQAIAPRMAEDATHNEMNLDPGTGTDIRCVVVIGAGSGDEAAGSLRDFLFAFDRVPNAAMLVVIHHHGDDLQALAASLDAGSASLKVGVATAGARISHGQVLLVPAGRQAVVGRNGTVQLHEAEEQALSSPSIDLTMTLVAQEMGENALAVVLAGDAIDALAGAQAIADQGGSVWTLDPADCSENTMVSVICEEQLAQFTGTPQALAARVLEEYT